MIDFVAAFEHLTGHRIPATCDLPTGLGKTTVVAEIRPCRTDSE